MARYTGPKSKIARKFGEPIYGSDKNFEKRNYPPGMHGANKRRKKVSEYGIQLQEKQKAKYTYGVLERQFRKTFEHARRKEGVTGLILMQLLESRLDNVVYRLGIAPTRAAARQLVNHRHIVVNGSVLSIPSYFVKVGDVHQLPRRPSGQQLCLDGMGFGQDVRQVLELPGSRRDSGEHQRTTHR